MNHMTGGEGYVLTPKAPTWRHHCLAHVLSVANSGTIFGDTEVWGGPLAGDYVIGLLNRGSTAATIEVEWSMLGIAGVSIILTLMVLLLPLVPLVLLLLVLPAPTLLV